MKIIVSGSYNASMTSEGRDIPAVGQTLIGDNFFVSAGGKGSNQAIAARFQDGDVMFIGKLGNDIYAEDALDMYKTVGLYGETIYRDDSVHTGIALIFVNERGDNSIMVCPGANLRLTADEITAAVLREEDVFIAGFQLETDIKETCEAIRRLHAAGIRTLCVAGSKTGGCRSPST